LAAKIVVAAAGPGQDQDPAFVEEVHWSEVAGRRARNAVAFMQSRDDTIRLVSLAIALEASRRYTFILLRFSKRYPDIGLHPPLCTVANPTVSPIVRILQYYSFVLNAGAGTTPRRLNLLLGALQCGSVPELWEKHPAVASHLRTLLISAASWFHRHHAHHLTGWPWKLAVLADCRAQPSHQRQVLEEWETKLPCCLDPHFSLKLRNLPTALDLRTSQGQEFLLGWAADLRGGFVVISRRPSPLRFPGCLDGGGRWPGQGGRREGGGGRGWRNMREVPRPTLRVSSH
jgi:hypothetical protein